MDTTKLRPQIKALWVEALTSGRHIQGECYLTMRDEDGTERDCCWGVLCKLAVLAGVIQPAHVGAEYGPGAIAGPLDYGQHTTELPPTAVLRWAFAAISDADAEDVRDVSVPYGHGDKYLASLNDTYVPHAEIAGLIDQHL